MPEETVSGMEFFVKEREVRLLQKQKIIRHPGPAIDKTKQRKLSQILRRTSGEREDCTYVDKAEIADSACT